MPISNHVNSVTQAAKEATPDVTLLGLVTVVGTVLGSLQLFQPKFAISLTMKRQAGGLERGFIAFYQIPLYITLFLVLLLWGILVLAVVHSLAPTAVPAFPVLRSVLKLLELQNLVPLLLMAGVVASFIQLNILSWIFLIFGRGLSLLPIPILKGSFGTNGRSAGWLQSWNLCSMWDKGQPLLISQIEVERIGDEVLRRLAVARSRTKNFAPKPTTATNEAAANIALLGCILEEAHSINHWIGPNSWQDFYVALSEINGTNKMFEPAILSRFAGGRVFSQALRTQLASLMISKGHPVPEGNYFGAAAYIARSWSLLVRTKGSILYAIPRFADLFGGRSNWLNRRLAKFPLLQHDGMRQQVLKLMARWNISPWLKAEGFLQPFSKHQAWLLLEEGALVSFPEQKDVTFRTSWDVGIFKIACRRIYEHVERTAKEQLSAEAAEVARRHSSNWDLAEAADYTFWDWAYEEAKNSGASNWSERRWRIQDSHIVTAK